MINFEINNLNINSKSADKYGTPTKNNTEINENISSNQKENSGVLVPHRRRAIRYKSKLYMV